MKILRKDTTPQGVEIQLEDWREHNTEEYPDLHGLEIHAYPIAKHTGRYGWAQGGKKFALIIAYNAYAGYSNADVEADYNALISGTKTLEDLSDHFYNGKKDMYYLGMIYEEPIY